MHREEPVCANTAQLCFPACFPATTDARQKRTSRSHRFITLTLNSNNTQIPCLNKQQVFLTPKHTQTADFESDKEAFLKQIRSFSSGGSGGSGGGTESSSVGEGLLQSIRGEMFSDMFLSSSVRGKILLQESLGSIAEVHSQMEMSCPTESLVNTLQFADEL